MATDRLPHIDEHCVEIEATPAATWEALLGVVERSFGSARTARVAGLLGCADTEPSGPRPLQAGSTLPGFHVERAKPGSELELQGSHRFSSYALTFRLDGPADGPTRLRAQTRATFPGLKGAAYKTAVIRTRAHVLVTRRLLEAVKRRTERLANPPVA
jgi:hypothetical protein